MSYMRTRMKPLIELTGLHQAKGEYPRLYVDFTQDIRAQLDVRLNFTRSQVAKKEDAGVERG